MVTSGKRGRAISPLFCQLQQERIQIFNVRNNLKSSSGRIQDCKAKCKHVTEQCDTLLLKAASQTGSSMLLQPTRLTEPRFLELLPAPGCCRYLGAAVIKHVRAKRGTSHPVHQSFCLSPTCSGVSELPGLSVEPPAVTNTCLAEKAKYQRLARLIVYNVLT